MPALFETPEPELTFLEETRDAASATGWLLGRGPAEWVQVTLGDVESWRLVYSGKTAGGAAGTLPDVAPTHPLLWLLGGTVLAGLGVAVIVSLDSGLANSSLASVDLPSAIRAMLAAKKYCKTTPYEINNGECEDFAMDVVNSLGCGYPHPEVGEETTPSWADTEYPGHFWLSHNGKHYDAEAPEGVDRWEDLPIFVNFRRKHAPK